MDNLVDAFNWFINFLSGNGEISIWEHITAYLFIWWMKVQIYGITFAWGVAEAVIDQLSITQTINSTFANIDGNIKAFMTILKVPDGLNLLVQAHVTRLVMTFLKF